MISLYDVVDIKVGRWHSGRWAGGALVAKIIWKQADNLLSSGFVLSRDSRETDVLVERLRAAVVAKTARAQQRAPTDARTSRG